jgi:hypothetical protein
MSRSPVSNRKSSGSQSSRHGSCRTPRSTREPGHRRRLDLWQPQHHQRYQRGRKLFQCSLHGQALVCKVRDGTSRTRDSQDRTTISSSRARTPGTTPTRYSPPCSLRRTLLRRGARQNIPLARAADLALGRSGSCSGFVASPQREITTNACMAHAPIVPATGFRYLCVKNFRRLVDPRAPGARTPTPRRRRPRRQAARRRRELVHRSRNPAARTRDKVAPRRHRDAVMLLFPLTAPSAMPAGSAGPAVL